MLQGSAAVSRLFDRLALLSTSRGDASGTSEAFDPFGGIGRTAARVANHRGVQKLVPIGVCALVVLAALVSSLPEVTPAAAAARPSVSTVPGAAAPYALYGQGDGPLAADSNDIYLGDGSIPNTLQNPGVGTDARTQLRTYYVKAGDTLGKIAGAFGLTTSTIYWANKASLPNPSNLYVGQQLLIPPMDGLLVKVAAKDTLDTLDAKYNIAAQDIVDANNLPDSNLVVGQTLLIPGASGGPVPIPKSSGGGRTVTVGSWIWPVSGSSYISQTFWSGHHAIDIAAQYGTAVVAAAGGTVVMAGWRSYTGGGNVVWIMHGAKLYSTYNHLSTWSVRVGQTVSAGQVIAHVGLTGVTTGPHLHFEVWLGYPWALGTDSDAVNPCAYLAGC